MDVFLKALAGVLIALVLTLVLHKQGKDISLVLTLLVCGMVMLAALEYLAPIVEFIENLRSIGKLDAEMLQLLMKAMGMCLLGEIASMICLDSGNAAMGKTVQFLTAAIVLFISLPLFNSLLELISGILEDV